MSTSEKVGKRRKDIEEHEEKGFRKAVLTVDESKVKQPPEGGWFVVECFPTRLCLCWFFPFVFRGLFKSPTLQDMPKMQADSECSFMERKFDYIWPKIKGYPLRLLLTMNYCFGLEYFFAGFLQLSGTTTQIFLPKVMEKLLKLLYLPLKEDSTLELAGLDFLRQILPDTHDVSPLPDDSDITRPNNWEAWVYLGLLISIYLYSNWSIQYSLHLSGRVGMKVRTVLVSKIYEKSLKMSNKARGEYENGVIMNHVGMDAIKFERVHIFLHYGWTSFILTVGSIYFLVDLIDWGALSGTLTNALLIPVAMIIIVAFVVVRVIQVKIVDRRVNRTNEILQSVRIIKFFSWESAFAKKVTKTRFWEVFILRFINTLQALLGSAFNSVTSVVCLVAFLTYYFRHGYIDPIAVFTSLTYFNMMKIPLIMIPMIIVMLLDMMVSYTRIQKLLESDEVDVFESSENHEYPVVIEHGSFKWVTKKKKDQKELREERKMKVKKLMSSCCCCLSPCLCKKRNEGFELPPVDYNNEEKEEKDEPMSSEGEKEGESEKKKFVNMGVIDDINLRVKKGNLCMVIGSVGSGKSSLCYAILGEMKRLGGVLETTKDFAFTSQLSWMKNGTLYDNVCFLEDKNEEKWERIVDVCCLQQDLDELKGGRNIEIGEKGINLSGGQKYRIQLARVCYSNCSCIILDDPLAAVDAHVGKRLFFDCIQDYLKDRTRILVTHQLQYLPHADWIVLMDEGTIKEQGTYNDLMSRDGIVSKLVNEYVESQNDDDDDDDGNPNCEEIIIEDTVNDDDVDDNDDNKKKEEELGDIQEDVEEEEGGEEIIEVKEEKETAKTEEDEDDTHPISILYSQDSEIVMTSEVEATIARCKNEAKENCTKRKEERLRRILSKKKTSAEEENKLMQEEEIMRGMISPKVIWRFVKLMGCCGIIPIVIVVLAYIYGQMFIVGADWWLAEWSDGKFNEKMGNEYHLYHYIGDDGKMHYMEFDEYEKYPTPVQDTNMTVYNSTNSTYPIIRDGEIDCTMYNSPGMEIFTKKTIPDNYDCPSLMGWCGCFDMYVPVVWDGAYDNGTLLESGLKQEESVYIYSSFGLLIFVHIFVRQSLLYAFFTTAAHRIHNLAIKRVLKAPMYFFDTTPIGRIISRFTQDITLIDFELNQALSMVFNIGSNCLGMFFMICYNTDGYGVAFVIPLLICYLIFYLLYRKTNLELKRLEAVTKTPILSHISESLNGLPTIRAYHAEDTFMKVLREKIDLNNRAYWMMLSAQRWLGIYLSLMGCLFVFCVCAVLILFYYYWDDVDLDISYTSLAISYALTATQMFFNVVEQMCEAEVKFNSVERLDFYTQNIPIEEPFDPDLRKPKNFVKKGTIEFKNYSMRYRKGLELVLKDLSFSIRSNERIGIVGRTGSGKSSIMVALWRIVESSRGHISIDGHRLDQINLIQLRNSLSIIPQDATLFSGTVRSNLDPFNEYSDRQCWKALEQSYLKDKVMSIKGKLSGVMKEGGSNFSVGERQLFCLARALLRNTKILVLDEATASVDMATDEKIQKTIRESFTNCTSLTIAHRLETIIDSDRILVMDDGRAVEFDTPRNLLEKTGKYHILRDLVHETGVVNEALLYNIAFGIKQIEFTVIGEKEEEEQQVDVDDDDDQKEDVETDDDDDDDDDSGSTAESDDDD